MVVRLLYFASLRERIGVGEEVLTLPETVTSPRLLADWLAARGTAYAEAFKDPSRLRCAVDQEIADWDAPLGTPEEIAFFPPVTGG